MSQLAAGIATAGVGAARGAEEGRRLVILELLSQGNMVLMMI